MPRVVRCCVLLLMVVAVSSLPLLASSTEAVQASREGNVISLSNDAISATWSVQGGALRWQGLQNRFTQANLPLDGSVFELVPKEGPVLRSSDFKMTAAPTLEDIPVASSSSKAADRLPGRQIRIELEDASARIRVTWIAMLREGANYIRQEVTIHAIQKPFALTQINLVDAVMPGAAVSGHVKGSPVTAGTWFVGFEHPLSDCRVRDDRASCWLSRELPLQAGQAVTYSSVFGVTHPIAVAPRLSEISRTRTRASL